MQVMRKLVVAVVAILMVSSCAANSNDSGNSDKNYLTYVEVGQNMPVLSFSSIEGEAIDLKTSHKPKLVVLFATWCSDSQRFLEQLSHSPLAKQNKVDILAIGREETRQSLHKFRQEFAIDFAMVADEDRSIYKQFANAGIPRVILLDEKNKIVKTLIGEDPNTIDQLIW